MSEFTIYFFIFILGCATVVIAVVAMVRAGTAMRRADLINRSQNDINRALWDHHHNLEELKQRIAQLELAEISRKREPSAPAPTPPPLPVSPPAAEVAPEPVVPAAAPVVTPVQPPVTIPPTPQPEPVAFPHRAEPVEPSPIPSELASKPSSWFSEANIGKRWMTWAGVLALFFAVGFFLKFAYDQGWLSRVTPVMRIVMGLTAGVALTALGEYFTLKKMRALGQGLAEWLRAVERA